MFSTKVRINLEKKDDLIDLEPLGDIHVGHVGFNEKYYSERVSAIAGDPNRYTLFMGDQLDAITPYDKRFNPDMVVHHDVDNQRERWQELTIPLLERHRDNMLEDANPKILGLLHGNHEYMIRGVSRPYIENTMCKPHLIRFLGSRAMIGLEVAYGGRTLNRWSILAIHGSGGGRADNLFERMKRNNYCDIFLCGHLHQKQYKSQLVYAFDYKKGACVQQDIHMANTGSFCETTTEGTDGYLDRKTELLPSEIGTITLTLNAYEGKVNGHV